MRGNGPPASSNHYCRVERSLDFGLELFKKTFFSSAVLLLQCFHKGSSVHCNAFSAEFCDDSVINLLLIIEDFRVAEVVRRHEEPSPKSLDSVADVPES